VPKPLVISVQIGLTAFIPTQYVGEARARMDFYRRFVLAVEEKDLDLLQTELEERFGPLPEETQKLVSLHRLRIRAAGCGVQAISRVPEGLMLATRESDSLARLLNRHGMIARPLEGMVHLPLSAKAARPENIVAALLKSLASEGDLGQHAGAKKQGE
jgi:transcription-repair coupling factor (superfamily II helicase)